MADRKVWWKAVADFSQIRKEAERTSRSIKDLEDRQESLGNTSEESAEQISEANLSTARSRKDDTKAADSQWKVSKKVSDSHVEEEKTTSGLRGAIRKVTSARKEESDAAKSQLDILSDIINERDEEAEAATALAKTLSRLTKSRKDATDAADKQKKASQATVAAQQAEAEAADRLASTMHRVEQANLRVVDAEHKVERASKSLTKAQKALDKVQKDASASAEDLSQAQELVEEAQARVARSTNDLNRANLSLEGSSKRAEKAQEGLAAATARVADEMETSLSAQGRFNDGLSKMGGYFRNVKRDASGFGSALTLLKFTGLAAGIGGVVTALGGLVGGLTAVAGAIGPVFTSLATLPALASGVVTGAGTTIAGFNGIGTALKAHQKKLQEAKGDVDEYAEAMANLTPAGRSFVTFLQGLKDELKSLRDAAQEGLLPGVEDGLRNLLELLPLVRKSVGDMAKILGGGFEDLTETMTSLESQSMLADLFNSNERATRSFVSALSPLYLGITRLAWAARPLTEYLADLVLRFGEWTNEATKAGVASGGLADAMDRAKRSIGLVGSVLGNFGVILLNVGRGGYETGMDLLGVFDQWLEKWADFTGSTEGQNSLKKWFEDTKPMVMAVSHLVGRISQILADLAVNPSTAAIIEKLAGPGMDAVERIINVFAGSEIGEGMADSLISIAEALATLLENGGGDVLASFANGVAAVVDAFAGLVAIPGVASTLTALAAAVGTFKAAKFAGTVTGVTALAKGGKKAVDRRRERGAEGGGGGGFFGSFGGRDRDRDRKRREPATDSGAGSKKKGFSFGKMAKGGGLVGGLALLAGIVLPTEKMGKFGDVLEKVLGFLGPLSLAIPILGAVIAAIGWPITLAVGAIVGLVGGITLLWNKNEAFRGWVIGAWESIKNAVVGAWQNYIWPALQAFGGFIMNTVWPAIQSLWNGAVAAFTAIGSAISTAWTSYIQPALAAIGGFITGTVWPAIQSLWNGAVTAFNAIGAVISFAWNNIIKPPFEAMWGFINDKLVPVLAWLHHNSMVMFGFIGALIKFVWNTSIKPIFAAIRDYITLILVPNMQDLWDKVKSVFTWIGDKIRGVWDNYIKPAFVAIKNYVTDTIVPTFQRLWDKTKDTFDKIGNKIRGVWNTYIKPAWNALVALIGAVLMPKFQAFWDKVRPIMDSIGNKIRGVWNNYIKPAFEAIGDYVFSSLPEKFRKGVDAIKGAWDSLKRKIAEPINWVIGNVINDGLIGTFNKIAGAIGAQKMTYASKIRFADGGPVGVPKKKQRFATGGKVRGISSGPKQDNIDARLTAGEWVQPVSAVQYYGPRFMELIRRRAIPQEFTAQFANGGQAGASPAKPVSAAGPRRYAEGGFIDTVKSAGSWLKDKASGAYDTAKNMLNNLNPINAIKGAVSSALEGMPGGAYIKQLVGAVPKFLAGKAGPFLKDKISILKEKLEAYQKTQRVAPAQGWRRMRDWAYDNIPGVIMTSGLRTGTLGGKSSLKSYHNRGRAVDLAGGPGFMAIFNKIAATHPNATELIYSGAGSRQLWHGQPHYYTGQTRAIHWDHVHWAMNQGGPAGGVVPSGGTARRKGRSLSNPFRYASGGAAGTRSKSSSLQRFASGGPVTYNTPRFASGGGVAFSPSGRFASEDFRSVRSNVNGSVGVSSASTYNNYEGDYNNNMSIVTNVYNPTAEKASDSVQQRLTRTAQLGLIGGRRSST